MVQNISFLSLNLHRHAERRQYAKRIRLGTIRSSTHLTEENWHTILHAMTAPCSVKEISERTGIERHTAEVVSYEKKTDIYCINPVVSIWSGLRGSNPLPRPWQGRALPSELNPRSGGATRNRTGE